MTMRGSRVAQAQHGFYFSLIINLTHLIIKTEFVKKQLLPPPTRSRGLLGDNLSRLLYFCFLFCPAIRVPPPTHSSVKEPLFVKAVFNHRIGNSFFYI